jgi:hypothetical protein
MLGKELREIMTGFKILPRSADIMSMKAALFLHDLLLGRLFHNSRRCDCRNKPIPPISMLARKTEGFSRTAE